MEKNVQTIKKNLKKIIKVFITYTIENDTRIYQLKHTPFKVEIINKEGVSDLW